MAGSIWRRLFPPPPDFLGLLAGQVATAAKAVDCLIAWLSEPREEHMEGCFRLEKEGDAVRWELVRALSTAFDTPLDREDLDDVSRCIDDIVDGVRACVREFAAIQVVPDDCMRDMAGRLREGLDDLGQAVASLPRQSARAVEHSLKARHSHRYSERLYSQGLATLFEQDDWRTVMRLKECYRQMLELSKVVETAAQQLEHAINKLA